MQREMLSPSPCYPVIVHMGMVQSCSRGGSEWTFGGISLPRGWPHIGTDFPERWSMFHVCQCVKGIWSMALITCFNFCPEMVRQPGKMISVSPSQSQSSLVHSITNKKNSNNNKIK